MEGRLQDLFPDYSQLSDLVPRNHERDQRCEEMSCGDDTHVQDQESDATPPADNAIQIPMDREAGKAVAAYPFQKPRDPKYNFWWPFRNAMDYKLTCLFCLAHVPRVQVDEFFRSGFLTSGSDASHISATFSFKSSYTLYKKIDKMAIDPPWKNGFVDFKLATNIEFWYRDILLVLKYLLRQKSFASQMVWTPIQHYDSQGERVYTEMNTGTWWWHTQALLPDHCGFLVLICILDGTSNWSYISPRTICV